MVKKILAVDPWAIIKHPILSEKAIGRIETENKIVFEVSRNVTKSQIKWAVETAFNVKVADVATLITQKGHKRAWIKLKKEFSAADIATKLGML
ncbi:MAG: 50S ribosomal protein L23 [Nanoarchaeota archaeon]|nr:50S ribosomal protein L23 [Nanoarchaeota archaeon]MBU4123869.1 50S ribosomal protein L23 [Nanoarchaeota archaeon]